MIPNCGCLKTCRSDCIRYQIAKTSCVNYSGLRLRCSSTREPLTLILLLTLAQRRGDSQVWTPSYALADALGTVRELLAANQTISDMYLYDAYGNLRSVTGATVNPFRYVGQLGYYFDPDTGTMNVRARVYQPSIIRWVSEDPIGYQSGDVNEYRYVQNSPVNQTDPSGLAAPPTPFGYGNFCGLERAAVCVPAPTGSGLVPAPPPINPAPIDALDAACAAHDCCLATWKEFVKEYCLRSTACNATFCKAVKAIDCDRIYRKDPVMAYQCNLMKKNAEIAFC